MTKLLELTPESLTLKLNFAVREFQIRGATVVMRELDTRLAFARKAPSLHNMVCGRCVRVFVFDTQELEPALFDQFANGLCRNHAWLVDRFACVPMTDARACLMVHCPSRPILFVDTEGYNYARYVARLG